MPTYSITYPLTALPPYLLTYLPTDLPTYLPTCLPAYLPAYLPALPTRPPTCLPTYSLASCSSPCRRWSIPNSLCTYHRRWSATATPNASRRAPSLAKCALYSPHSSHSPLTTPTTLTTLSTLTTPTTLTTLTILTTPQVRQFQDNARRLAEYEVHILADKASLAELEASGGGGSGAARELKTSLREVARIASVTYRAM